MERFPEPNSTPQNVPPGFHNEGQGQGNDPASIARIRADQQFPASPNWRLGKWIGPAIDKPQWLTDQEQATSRDDQPTTL